MNTNNYDWAVNRNKLSRAITDVKTAGEVVNNETVKARYIKLGGLVKEVVSDSPVAATVAPKPEPKAKPEPKTK